MGVRVRGRVGARVGVWVGVGVAVCMALCARWCRRVRACVVGARVCVGVFLRLRGWACVRDMCAGVCGRGWPYFMFSNVGGARLSPTII